MSQSEDQDLDVDALMRQIRIEITGRMAQVPGREPTGTNGPETIKRGVFNGQRVALPRLMESAPAIPRRRAYTLRDFLNYHDEDFVRNAYRGVLGREPDAEGARRFLAKLRTGDFAKVEILGRIRFSPEGRAAGVRVSGVVVPFTLRTLRRVPVLGHALGIVQYILRLPNMVRNHERLEAVVFLHQLEMRRSVNAITAEVEAALQRSQVLAHGSRAALEGKIAALERAAITSLDDVTEQLESMAARLADKVDRQEAATLEQRIRSELNAQVTHVGAVIRNTNAELTTLRSLVGALEQRAAEQPPGVLLRETIAVAAAAKIETSRIADELTTLRADAKITDTGLATIRADAVRIDAKLTGVDQHLLAYRQSLLDQERRLGILLGDSNNRPLDGSDLGQSSSVREERDHLLDGFYVSFENTFRGTREDIKRRAEVYLPYVREAGAGVATAPILDIGCGRGEWLELLSDNGLAARGIDLNRVTAADCRERGLVVAEADALDYLRGVDTASIGAVTAIHVIEHLPFRQLMCLFDEVRRVLKPGGVAIFETPNPENLVVGACNFWYDPTHRQPLPPEPMRFILDNRGFARVEILRLHPSTDMSIPTEAPNELSAAIAERFYGPQDYALVGYKS
jgi:SAM-dependent methyltransferase